MAGSDHKQAKQYASEAVQKCTINYKQCEQSLKTKKCSDLAASIAINTVIHDKDSTDLIELINTLNNTIISSLIDHVTICVPQKNKTLTRDHINYFIDMIKKEHLLCLICCKILELINKAEEEICKQVEAMVKEYLRINFTELNDTLKTILVTASKTTAVKIVSAIKQVSQINTIEKSLQVATLIFCPDYSKHPEVLNLCFKPLTQEAIGQELNNIINKELGTTGKESQKIGLIEQSTSVQNNDFTTSEINTSSDSREPFSSQQYPTDQTKNNDLFVPHTESSTLLER